MFVARSANDESVRAVPAGSNLSRNRHAVCGRHRWIHGTARMAFASCAERNYRLPSIRPKLMPANASRAAAPVVLLESMFPALNATNPPLIAAESAP